jgi:hypothetical protein
MADRGRDAGAASRSSAVPALGSLRVIACHPPRPPVDGICDLQATIADCSVGDLDPPALEIRTARPEKVGSGKFGTLWARMHLAQLNHACCWAGESCWPLDRHGEGRALQACSAPWNASEFGLIPVVLYP